MNETDDTTEEKVFEYLVDLRDTGVTNMFGAGQFLQSKFGFNKKEAKEWLGKWMDSFKEE